MRKTNKKLYAFLVTFSYQKQTRTNHEGQGFIKNIAIVAHTDEEARAKVVYHYCNNLGYSEDALTFVAIQKLKKNKVNEYYYSYDYYTKQEAFINDFKRKEDK